MRTAPHSLSAPGSTALAARGRGSAAFPRWPCKRPAPALAQACAEQGAPTCRQSDNMLRAHEDKTDPFSASGEQTNSLPAPPICVRRAPPGGSDGLINQQLPQSQAVPPLLARLQKQANPLQSATASSSQQQPNTWRRHPRGNTCSSDDLGLHGLQHTAPADSRTCHAQPSPRYAYTAAATTSTEKWARFTEASDFTGCPPEEEEQAGALLQLGHTLLHRNEGLQPSMVPAARWAGPSLVQDPGTEARCHGGSMFTTALN